VEDHGPQEKNAYPLEKIMSDPLAPPATEQRTPDVVVKIVRLEGERRTTEMVSSEASGKVKKLEQRAVVVSPKTGHEVTVPLVGTPRQFEVSDLTHAEGYLSKDGKRMYFQPALGSASSDANDFL